MTDEKRKVAQLVGVEEITPWPGNPKKHTREQIDEIAALIRRFGFGRPLLVRAEDGEIIAGHGAYAAALQLGMTKVPVRFMDLSAEEAHQMAIAENAVAEHSTWDDAMVAAVAREQKLDEAALRALSLAPDYAAKIARSVRDEPVVEVEGGTEPKRGRGAPGLSAQFTDEATRDKVKALIAAEAEKGEKEPSGDTLARLLGVLPRRRAKRAKAAEA